MAKSTIYLRKKLAESILHGTPYSVSNLHVGLFRTLPTLDDASDGVEHTIGQGGYARVTVKNLWDQDQTILPVVKYNLNTLISFESRSNGWNANGTVAPVVGVGFYDAATDGNCLMFAALDPVREIYPNQDMDINIDALTIEFTVA